MEKLMSGLDDYRAGYVALLGRPNVGKSTLLNHFLKYKLSIVSRKPQTTRRQVLGILSSHTCQIIFIDTPGMLEPRYNLQQIMMRFIAHAIDDADLLVYLADASQPQQDYQQVRERIAPIGKPVILALNKIDLIEKETLLPLIAQYNEVYPFAASVPISALKDDGLDRLLEEIKNLLPLSPPYFPPDYITNQEERFFVGEIVREKIFNLYGEEIPYSTHVQIEEFKERPGRKDYIRAVVFVEKPSQKGIIIGKRGRALKRVGQFARREIEAFLGRPVYLELFVKVLEDWRRKDASLKRLGYR